jgi:hypothetical protein
MHIAEQASSRRLLGEKGRETHVYIRGTLYIFTYISDVSNPRAVELAAAGGCMYTSFTGERYWIFFTAQQCDLHVSE